MVQNEEEKFIQNIGRRIFEIRRKRGLRQQDLADLLNVSLLMIQRWEAGQNVQSLTLFRLSKALGCAPGDLFKPARAPKQSAGRPKKQRK